MAGALGASEAVWMQRSNEWLTWPEGRMQQELLDVQRAHKDDASQSAREQIGVLERSVAVQSAHSDAMRNEMHAMLEVSESARYEQREATWEALQATDRLTSTVESGFSDLGDRLCSELAHIDTTLSGMAHTIEDGFGVANGLLARINKKLDWSDEYKRFLRFKRDAFEMARVGDQTRALRQALAAISIRDTSGSAEDQIERDPLLCAFLARLLSVQEFPDYAGPHIRELAQRAMDRGRIDGTEAELQAASDGARVLAICCRATGDWTGATKHEEIAQECARSDVLTATARMLAARCCTAPSPALFDDIAAHAVVYDQFLAIWLTQACFVLRPDKGSAAIAAVGKILTTRLLGAGVAREGFCQLWTSRLSELDLGAAGQAHWGFAVAGGQAPVAALVVLASEIREVYRSILRGEASAPRVLTEACTNAKRPLEDRFWAKQKASGIKHESAVKEEQDAFALASSGFAERISASTSISASTRVAVKKIQPYRDFFSVFVSVSSFFGSLAAPAVERYAGCAAMALYLVVLIGAPLLWVSLTVRSARRAKRLEDGRKASAIEDQQALVDLKRRHEIREATRRERFNAAVGDATRDHQALKARLAEGLRSALAMPTPPFAEPALRSTILRGLQQQNMTATDAANFRARAPELWSSFEVMPQRGRPLDELIEAYNRSLAG